MSEQETSVVWEPWRPKVGQRVRVRLSPECCATTGIGWVDDRGYAQRTSHDPEENGRTGCVRCIYEPHACLDQSHLYLVEYDEGYPQGAEYPTQRGNFAAVELEPLAE